VAQSIWNGYISFGLVTIPVHLSAATEPKDIALNQVCREHGDRIRLEKRCATDGSEVPPWEIVRGYELYAGHHVVLEEEDFDSLPVPSKHTIEITAFVDASEIEPAYHERGYFLIPLDTGTKAYRLLLRALENKNLVAIGKVGFNRRVHLCALRPIDGALATEVRPTPEVPEALVSPEELELAYRLMDLLHEPFAPEKYRDGYRVALCELIQTKAEGMEVTGPGEPPLATIPDLMEALRASVEAALGKPHIRSLP
jgi:DNA end-binding protein Ku